MAQTAPPALRRKSSAVNPRRDSLGSTADERVCPLCNNEACAPLRDYKQVPYPFFLASPLEQDAEALYHLMMGWIETRLVEGRIPEAAEVERLESFVMSGLERRVGIDERGR